MSRKYALIVRPAENVSQSLHELDVALQSSSASNLVKRGILTELRLQFDAIARKLDSPAYAGKTLREREYNRVRAEMQGPKATLDLLQESDECE